jgi:hypothetical protein
VALDQELRRIADAAVAYCAEAEELTGIVPAEPGSGVRVYVCAYQAGDARSWLVLDSDGHAVQDRSLVRDAVSIAALYELAEDAVGASGGEPHVATPAELDALGASVADRSGFAETMKQATGTVDELLREVESGYKLKLT